MQAKTLGELKASGYGVRPVKDELRANLIRKLRTGERLFPGIVGYDETVIPNIVNALLAKHNFILLGLRGQAKSRIIRQLADLLDESIPIIAGSEVNDNPFAPISAFGRQQIALHGDETKIAWLGRDARLVEKLATPDVTMADIIGDVDPIKAATCGHLLSDELTMHYGLLPRANRGLFAINELPDLAGKIQVGLFNVMQEGDVQLKGYPVRLPLDVLLVFSANPEDYTARGKIISPLKDRIGAEIMTHYPQTLDLSVAITRQEAWTERAESGIEQSGIRHLASGIEHKEDSKYQMPDTRYRIPDFLRDLVEQIAFEARDDQRVDKHSGVSQRFSITVLETIVSNAERRVLRTGESDVVPRISDLYAALPAMTGKMELEYEGEQLGAARLAKDLIKRAAGEIFEGYFVGFDFTPAVHWFDSGNTLLMADTAPTHECLLLLEEVPGLLENAAVPFDFLTSDKAQLVAACEFVLEGLYAGNKISRNEEGGYTATTKAKKDRRGMIFDDWSETEQFS